MHSSSAARQLPKELPPTQFGPSSMAKRSADGHGGGTAKRPVIEYVNLIDDSDDDEPKPKVGGRRQWVSPDERSCVCWMPRRVSGLQFIVRDPLHSTKRRFNQARRACGRGTQTHHHQQQTPAEQLAQIRRAQHQQWQTTPRSPPRRAAPQQALPNNLEHVFVAAAPWLPHAGPTRQCLGLPCVQRGSFAQQVFAATDAENATGLSLSARVQGRLLGRAFVGTSGMPGCTR